MVENHMHRPTRMLFQPSHFLGSGEVMDPC